MPLGQRSDHLHRKTGPKGEPLLLQLMEDKISLQYGFFMKGLVRQLVRSNQLNATDASNATNDEGFKG
jgi:hypothetical protein